MLRYHIVWLILFMLSLFASLLFAYLFYEMFWQWRGMFDENGRYFDIANHVVYHHQAKFYILPSVFCLCIAVQLFKKRKEKLN